MVFSIVLLIASKYGESLISFHILFRNSLKYSTRGMSNFFDFGIIIPCSFFSSILILPLNKE